MPKIQFIDANEVTLRTLLSNATEAYQVPLFQRPYAWEKEQWEDLFDDINRILSNEIHFLGSIVVVPEGPLKFGSNYFNLVDGQQRMSTVLILLSCLRDLFKEKGDMATASLIEDNQLFIRENHEGNLVKVPKLKLGKLDDPAFNIILKGKGITGRKALGKRHLILDCYDFYRSNLSNEVGKLSSFADILLDRVALVHINALNYLNAFRLFETLNDRGLELSAVDLVKNYLLQIVFSDEQLYESVIAQWNEMFEKVREIEPTKFLRRYLLSTVQGKMSERKLYEELKKKIEGEKWNPAKVALFVSQLTESAGYYKNIFDADFESKRIKEKLEELQLVEVGPSYTLLLKVLPLYEKETLAEEDLFEILCAIETFHIRWGVCGKATTYLDDIYNKICIQLADSNDRNFVMSTIANIYKEERSEIRDDAFLRGFIEGNFRGSERRTKYIIWRLSKPTGETTLKISQIQSEHIMPQTLSEQWRQSLKESGLKIEKTYSDENLNELHSDFVNRIGNLTLIKGKWNDSMSNKIFEKKKNEYYFKSEISLTKSLCKLQDWNFQTIGKRTTDLAETAVNELWRWPPLEITELRQATISAPSN